MARIQNVLPKLTLKLHLPILGRFGWQTTAVYDM